MVAAVEQFLRDTLPPPAPPLDRDPARDAWLRAARLEAAGHPLDGPAPWARW